MNMKGIKEQCTTPEQSKKLVELGFTEESASARIVHLLRNDWVVVTDNFVCYDEEYPCWTIADMMEIIKNCDVMWFEESEAYHSVSVVVDSNRFVYLRDNEDEENDDIEFYKKDSLRDNLFDCLVWLKENKYL